SARSYSWTSAGSINGSGIPGGWIIIVRRLLVAWVLLLIAWPLISPTFCENVKCRGAKGLIPRMECLPENASGNVAPGRTPGPQMVLARNLFRVGSCVDDARGARGFWLSACGRVQVMCPACLCGAMAAGPDVVRGSGPYHSPGLDTPDPKRVLPINR